MNNRRFQSGIKNSVMSRRRFLILVMISLIVLNSPVVFGSESSRPILIDLTAIIGSTVTAGIFLLNVLLKYSGKRHTEGFFVFTVGSFLWLVAELTWAYYRQGLGVEVPYPSVADLLWLIGYGFFLVHNYRLIAKVRQVAHIDRSMIVLVSAATGLTLGYILNLTFGVADIISSTTDSLSTVVSLLYPIIDGLILIPSLVIFWSLRRTDPTSMHWLLMSVAFVISIVADVGFGYSFALSPDIAAEYEWIWSIFFNACYVFLAAGGVWYYMISRQNKLSEGTPKIK
jgi:hypothetical protein